MTVKQIQDATDKARLINACNNFARVMQAVDARNDKAEVLSHKGKTLYHINRARQNTVKITVNY